MAHDPISSPHHYTSLGALCTKCAEPIECITISERFDFVLGNVIKYAWRAGLKNGIEDLMKCRWYINRAIENEEKSKTVERAQLAELHTPVPTRRRK